MSNEHKDVTFEGYCKYRVEHAVDTLRVKDLPYVGYAKIANEIKVNIGMPGVFVVLTTRIFNADLTTELYVPMKEILNDDGKSLKEYIAAQYEGLLQIQLDYIVKAATGQLVEGA